MVHGPKQQPNVWIKSLHKSGQRRMGFRLGEQTLNVLVVCSRNQWRSPTAETVWRKISGLTVRSVGTSPQARKTVTAADIRWADIILVMETKHKQRLRAAFRQLMSRKRLEVLDIPDDYQYMDPELVMIFEAVAEDWLADLPR